MRAKITMSKSGDFSKSRSHEMEWDQERLAWINPDNRTQGFQFIDPELDGTDLLGWLVGPEDKIGRARMVRMIGAPAGVEEQIEVMTRIIAKGE